MLAGPDGSGFTTELIAAGLNQPVAFDFAPDGRIFVAEREGRVVIVDNGAVTGTFLDINQEVHAGGDRGLLGLKLDPNFAANGKVYLQYSQEVDPPNPDNSELESPAYGQIISIEAAAT